MRFIPEQIDVRHESICFFCSDQAGITRDHVPPKVFLDRPYPENLPVVPSCLPCNSVTSADEEYVAAALEVVACKSVNTAELERAQIVKSLNRNGSLLERLKSAATIETDALSLGLEDDRFERVFSKVARGLLRFEVGEPTGHLVDEVRYSRYSQMSKPEVDAFCELTYSLLPEVGSRMLTTLVEDHRMETSWQCLQEFRFSYAIEITASICRVKMIVRGVLCVEVDLTGSRS